MILLIEPTKGYRAPWNPKSYRKYLDVVLHDGEKITRCQYALKKVVDHASPLNLKSPPLYQAQDTLARDFCMDLADMCSRPPSGHKKWSSHMAYTLATSSMWWAILSGILSAADQPEPKPKFPSCVPSRLHEALSQLHTQQTHQEVFEEGISLSGAIRLNQDKTRRVYDFFWATRETICRIQAILHRTLNEINR